MHYELNVSKDKIHYFATSDQSLLTLEQSLNMVAHFKLVFPESEGYAHLLTKHDDSFLPTEVDTSLESMPIINGPLPIDAAWHHNYTFDHVMAQIDEIDGVDCEMAEAFTEKYGVHTHYLGSLLLGFLGYSDPTVPH